MTRTQIQVILALTRAVSSVAVFLVALDTAFKVQFHVDQVMPGAGWFAMQIPIALGFLAAFPERVPFNFRLPWTVLDIELPPGFFGLPSDVPAIAPPTGGRQEQTLVEPLGQGPHGPHQD